MDSYAAIRSWEWAAEREAAFDPTPCPYEDEELDEVERDYPWLDTDMAWEKMLDDRDRAEDIRRSA